MCMIRTFLDALRSGIALQRSFSAFEASGEAYEFETGLEEQHQSRKNSITYSSTLLLHSIGFLQIFHRINGCSYEE